MSEPATGDRAPDFCLPATGDQQVCLNDLKGRWLVLYFYPKDSTPGCTKEGQAFRDLHGEFEKAGATVLGVSRDGVKAHENFKARPAPCPQIALQRVAGRSDARRGLAGRAALLSRERNAADGRPAARPEGATGAHHDCVPTLGKENHPSPARRALSWRAPVALKGDLGARGRAVFPFELLSDKEETLCNAFGVIKDKTMYGKKVRGIERSTFLIDPEGTVRAVWRKVKVDGHADAVLQTLRENA